MADDNRYGGQGGYGGHDQSRGYGLQGQGGSLGPDRGGQDRGGQDRGGQDRGGWGGFGQPQGGHDRGTFGGGQGQHRDPGQGFGGYSQGGTMGQGGPSQPGFGQPPGMGQPVPPPPAAFERSGRDNERFDNRDADHRVAIDETDRLIASNKVEGTRVYNRHGERLGTIYNFMVDKRSGRVEYAVMSFGGFLGMGERFYPLPWQVLNYDEGMGGYRININGNERELARAPSFVRGEEPRFDRAYGQHVYGFYGLTY